MKWFHGVMAALFALSALLQFNDPDPAIWIALYGAAAVLAGLAAAGRLQWIPTAVLGVVCAVWMLMLTDSVAAFAARGDWSLLAATMKASEPLIEESREFLGLGIVLAWCAVALSTRRPVRAV